MANRACAEIDPWAIKTFSDRQVPENWLADCERYPSSLREVRHASIAPTGAFTGPEGYSPQRFTSVCSTPR